MNEEKARKLVGEIDCSFWNNETVNINSGDMRVEHCLALAWVFENLSFEERYELQNNEQ